MAKKGFLDFLFSGKPPPAVRQSSQNVTGIPDYIQEYTKGLLRKSNEIAAQPWKRYTKPRIAGFTPEQEQSFQMAKQNVGNWQPWLNQGQQLATLSSQPGLNQNVFNSYMSPYTEGVINRIAQLGQRNLSENLLPQVNDTFTGAGQFGSSRHADFTNRAMRDVNESILGQQATALQQAHDAAMGNYQTGMSRGLQGAGAIGNMAQQLQGQGAADVASLGAVGETKQQQRQKNLDLAYQDFINQRDWGKNQAGWFSNMLHGVPAPTVQFDTSPNYNAQFSPSPMAQFAGLYSAFRGMG